jgi:hypothetical protein
MEDSGHLLTKSQPPNANSQVVLLTGVHLSPPAFFPYVSPITNYIIIPALAKFMHVYVSGRNRLFEPDQEFNPEYDSYDQHIDAIIYDFTKKNTYRSLLDTYGKANDLEGYIILKAHGIRYEDSCPPEWLFKDGDTKIAMQGWIDQLDGSALAILLYSCNTGGYELASRKSILIHPLDPVSVKEVVRGGHMRIFVPGEGYLENDYPQIRQVLKRLGQ